MVCIIVKAIYVVPISTIGGRAVLGSKSQYVCVYCQPAPNNNKVIAGQPIVFFPQVCTLKEHGGVRLLEFQLILPMSIHCIDSAEGGAFILAQCPIHIQICWAEKTGENFRYLLP